MTLDVFLAVGHGVEPNGVYDPGAIGSDGRQEHLEAYEICQFAVSGMRRSGLTVVSETAMGAAHDPDFVGSAHRANELMPKVAIEVHLDWREGVAGFSGLYRSTAGHALAGSIASAYDHRGLSVKENVFRGDLYFLNVTHMPALIPEINRTHDYSHAENDLQGEGIAEGVCRFLGRTYRPVGPPPPPEPKRIRVQAPLNHYDVVNADRAGETVTMLMKEHTDPAYSLTVTRLPQ